jgi:hypothetical protein
LVNKKYFSVKEKIGLVFRKIFSFYFRWKTLSRNCGKSKNIFLFVNYIKFGSQSFDCYIFCFEYFFSSISFLIFIPTLVLNLLIVIYFSLIIFLIEIIYLSNLVSILLTAICFIWNNLWNWFFFNFILFHIFYLSDLVSMFFIAICFIWNNLLNWIYFFNFIFL